ncbi:MAG: hypothetical protein AB7F86_12885 [Bdellovibrionales bacterium]
MLRKIALSFVFVTTVLACGQKKTTETVVVQPQALNPSSRTISIDPFSALLGGSASYSSGFGPNAGINLLEGGNGQFSFGFTVPDDLSASQNFIIRILWHLPETGCAVVLRPNYISVAKANSSHVVGGGAATGLAMVGGTVIAAPGSPDVSVVTEAQVSSPDGVTPFAPGDSVIVGFFRDSLSVSDTCIEDVTIQGLQVRY